MKKRIFNCIVLAIGICCNTFAQTVKEGEAAMVYYMPLTQLAITLEYDEISIEPGPFYQYATRYLGVREVVTEPTTRYELKSVRMMPHTVIDPKRSYKIIGGIEGQYLSFTQEGLLYGFNVPVPTIEPTTSITVNMPTALTETLMPLLEEQMIASSTAKMAEGAAKQIYQIRETRLNILAGDVEHVPADGQALLLTLEELEKQEQALTELFIGKRIVRTQTKTIYYTPGKDVSLRTLVRISQYAGIVATDDLSGKPLRISITGERQSLLPLDSKKKTSDEHSQLYYNIPGSAFISIDYAGKVIATATMPIAQYGIAVPLAKNILYTEKLPHIYFNTQTGNILSIQP